MDLAMLTDLKIVIIDDSKATLLAMKNLLEKHHCKVTPYADSENALAALRRSDSNIPDIIITDYEMPNLNGVELIRELKKEDHLKEVPTLVLTGRNISELLITAIQAGADAFASKESIQDIIIAQLLALVRIIHQRKSRGEIEANLRATQFKNLFDHLTEGILLLNESGKILYCNQSAQVIFDLSESELVGKKIYDAKWNLINKDLIPCTLNEHPAIRALKEKRIQSNQIFGIHLASDIIKWLSITAIPLLQNNEESPTQLILTFEDITEQLKLNETLKVTETKLLASAKMASLGEMAGGIAHEINNPLAIICGNTYLIKTMIEKGSLTASSFEQPLSIIEETTYRISKIINNLRSFAQSNDNSPYEVVKISEIIDMTLNLCTERFNNQNIYIQINIEADTVISCCPSQIAQALMNLLNNSYDAVINQKEKWIHLSVSQIHLKGAAYIRFSVSDSGPKISPSIAEKMMTPFFTTKEIGKGMGLGLSVASGLIASHGGQLYYDSAALHTQFTFDLPAEVSALDKPPA